MRRLPLLLLLLVSSLAFAGGVFTLQLGIRDGAVVMNDITVTHSRDSAFTATAGIGQNRDGTQETLAGSWATSPGGEWWTDEPDAPRLLALLYDVKFRRVSGRVPDFQSSWTDNVWIGFISTRHFYRIINDSGTPSTRTAVVEIQIRDKATDTVRGSIVVTLNAILT